jgi:hypothetical protein
MSRFKLKDEDMEKTAILFPLVPVMPYKWRELITLKKWVLYFFLFTTLLFIAGLAYYTYIAFRVFILDPEHRIWPGEWGILAGLIYLAVGYKLLQNCSRLLYFLVGRQKIVPHPSSSQK